MTMKTCLIWRLGGWKTHRSIDFKKKVENWLQPPQQSVTNLERG